MFFVCFFIVQRTCLVVPTTFYRKIALFNTFFNHFHYIKFYFFYFILCIYIYFTFNYIWFLNVPLVKSNTWSQTTYMHFVAAHTDDVFLTSKKAFFFPIDQLYGYRYINQTPSECQWLCNKYYHFQRGPDYECLKAFYTSLRCDYQLSRSLTALIDRKCKQLITQFCQTMQTTLINKVSMVHQDSIWFSLYERATINIIGGNVHFCALTVAPLLCLHGMWVFFC